MMIFKVLTKRRNIPRILNDNKTIKLKTVVRKIRSAYLNS